MLKRLEKAPLGTVNRKPRGSRGIETQAQHFN